RSRHGFPATWVAADPRSHGACSASRSGCSADVEPSSQRKRRMTPLQFEARYQADWEELQRLLHRLQRHERVPEPVSAERLASLYRRACEQLALARARAYPTHIIERLN